MGLCPIVIEWGRADIIVLNIERNDLDFFLTKELQLRVALEISKLTTP